MTKLDPKLAALVAKVTAKRPRAVLDHILKHGHVSTEELKDLYGYNHAPRAARDVRENGIPLETFKVRGKDGRSIAAYRFGDPNDIESHKIGGRQAISKQFGKTIIAIHNSRCAICGQQYEDRYFQIDHRIPFEVTGETGGIVDESQPDLYMPVCGSCNRKKSWSCEQCPNWNGKKDPEVCSQCYWANSALCSHIATIPIRRVEITWSGNQVSVYDKAVQAAASRGMSIQDFIRDSVSRILADGSRK